MSRGKKRMKNRGQCLVHMQSAAMQAALGLWSNATFHTPLRGRPRGTPAGARRTRILHLFKPVTGKELRRLQ